LYSLFDYVAESASTTVLFTAFRVGYNPDMPRKHRISSRFADTEMCVDFEITGSVIKNSKVIVKPTEIPIAPLTKMIIKA